MEVFSSRAGKLLAAERGSMRKYLALIAVGLGVALVGLQQTRLGRTRAPRKPAPVFTLKDVNGAAVRLSDYKGKVLLINFWETSCGPCRIEIPWLVEFQRVYRDR